jgi:hypothetical protein
MITKGEAEVTDKTMTVRDADGVMTLQDRFLTRYACVFCSYLCLFASTLECDV